METHGKEVSPVIPFDGFKLEEAFKRYVTISKLTKQQIFLEVRAGKKNLHARTRGRTPRARGELEFLRQITLRKLRNAGNKLQTNRMRVSLALPTLPCLPQLLFCNLIYCSPACSRYQTVYR